MQLKKASTVLIIDDDASVRFAVSFALGKASIRVLEAGSAAEGEKLWRQHRDAIDAVLVDITMPEMTGPELVDKLFRTASIPVIFITGLGRADALAATFDLPHAMVLEKPFTTQALLDAVQSHRLLSTPA